MNKKIGRNEPCPCGSGKKYKKCHGAQEPILSQAEMNTELNRIHQSILSFANATEGKIKEQIHVYDNSEIKKHKEIHDIFLTGLSLWIFTQLNFLTQKNTMLESFFNIIAPKTHPQIRRVLEKWLAAKPSIYEVASVHTKNKQVTLLDVLSKEEYQIPLKTGDDYVEGSIIIGTLVPLVGHHSFLLTMIKLFGIENETILAIAEPYTTNNQVDVKQFPQLLAEILLLLVPVNEDTAKNENQEQVAQLFAERMVEYGYDDSVVIQGLSIWKSFCETENPDIKNVESFAAALEYYVQKHLLNHTKKTQAQLAEEYGVSAGTLSAQYRKLVHVKKEDNKKAL